MLNPSKAPLLALLLPILFINSHCYQLTCTISKHNQIKNYYDSTFDGIK